MLVAKGTDIFCTTTNLRLHRMLFPGRCVVTTIARLRVDRARAESTREAPAKAEFLLDFARSTESPAEAFANDDSPIVVGILGTAPFGRTLDQRVPEEVVQGRLPRVRHCRKEAEIGTRHNQK
jgi:hypothetical protein